MAIKFKPIGYLDIHTDPSALPAESSSLLTQAVSKSKDEFSGAMRRCTNLKLTAEGVAKTRDGSSLINATAVAQTAAHLLIEMADSRYLFAGTVIYKDETSHGTGFTNAKWRGIQYNAWNDTTNNIFALNGTDRKRIDSTGVYNWGIAAPTTAPVLGTTGTGLTGDYNAKYTYVRKVGSTVVHESNPSSAAAAAQTLTNQNLTVNVVASSDAQVTNIRIYRTLTDGATYYYDQEVANTTATITSSKADSALGAELETNNDRPPSTGTVVVGPSYNGYCFIFDSNKLYFCKANRPESWPTAYYIEVGSRQYPLKSAVFYNNVLYVLNEYEMFVIQGSGYTSFFPYNLASLSGAVSFECAVGIKGYGIYHLGRDGLYLYDGTADQKISEKNLEPIFRGETVGSIPGISLTNIANSWLHVYKNKIYFGYPKSGSTFPDNILTINVTNKKIEHFDYSNTFRVITTDKTNTRLLAVDNSGYIRVLEDITVTTDSGTAISWQIESKSFSDQLYKYFPRYAKYDVELNTGASATGSILLDDTVIQTHTLSSRQTKRRLITAKNGDRIGVRIAGSGVATVRGVEIL